MEKVERMISEEEAKVVRGGTRLNSYKICEIQNCLYGSTCTRILIVKPIGEQKNILQCAIRGIIEEE